MGKGRFRRNAEQYMDGRRVDEVLMIQQRPVAGWLVAIGLFIVVAVLLTLAGLPGWLVAGVGGGVMGAAFASLVNSYYLISSGPEVHMVKLKKITAKPETTVKVYSKPLPLTEVSGLFNKAIEFDGERYVVSKIFSHELAKLTA